ncbi:MAG: sensor histidine kinase [Gammaproteobacteria bacterium]
MIDLFKMNAQLSELPEDYARSVNNRGARELGGRLSGFIFMYPLLGVIFLVHVSEYYSPVLQWLIGLIVVISTFRIISGKRLSKAPISTTEENLKSYGSWTLANTLCVGTFAALLSFETGISDEFMIIVGILGGLTAIMGGTMTLYFRFWTLYTSTLSTPIVIACLYHGMIGDSKGYFLALISFLFTVIVIVMGRRVEKEYWRGEVAQTKLEQEALELKLALKQIEEKETELRKHRDHLQEMVEEQVQDMRLSKEAAEHAEEMAEQAREAAERASESKSEFLANMSHELRTPIHAILSFSKIGKNKTKDTSEEILERFFTQINGSGHRLLELVDNLLDMSKMEAMKMEYHFEKADLGNLIRQSVAEQETRLQELKLKVEIIPVQFRTIAEIDSVRIGQVITNLFSNAIKFTPEGKTITFSIEQDEVCPGRRKGDDAYAVPALSFKIRDEGIGIPEAELTSIFDKFVQSTKTKNEAGGTGLGLSICREIIHAHRGELWVEKNKGEGVCFCFLIPITKLVYKEKNKISGVIKSESEEIFETETETD